MLQTIGAEEDSPHRAKASVVVGTKSQLETGKVWIPLSVMVPVIFAFNAPGRACEDSCAPALTAYYACFEIEDSVDRGLCAFDRAVDFRICELNRD